MNFPISVSICTIALLVMFISAIVGMKNKIKTAAFLMILSMICMLAGLTHNTKDVIGSMKETYDGIIEEMKLEVLPVDKIETVIVPEFYYEGAEIADQKRLDDGTYEIRFVANGEFYIWIDKVEYPEDAPYLLTMESNETVDLKDDEIVVVWKDMN